MRIRGLIAAVALFGATAGGAFAQADVSTDVVARGNLDVGDGPQTVYIGSIQMAPGSSYAGWHMHPGPVWVVVSSGELALYGPDACRTTYAAGAAYLAEPQTVYDLRNETDQPLELHFAGVIPAGQPPTLPAAAPSTTCPG
jgi:quercetin dioxygenase-like cupin family protein